MRYIPGVMLYLIDRYLRKNIDRKSEKKTQFWIAKFELDEDFETILERFVSRTEKYCNSEPCTHTGILGRNRKVLF